MIGYFCGSIVGNIYLTNFSFIRNCGFFTLSFLLVSCSTPEFRQEQNICTSKWMDKILPRYEQESYLQTLSREVPTGETTCITTGFTTTCKQEMRTEYYSVPAVRTVDRNESRRVAKINACTQNKCLKKYGNATCEID